MEEPAQEKRNYELAYHLTADLDEGAVSTRMHDLETLITAQGGSIITSREPKKMHLSYPINHKHYGMFGVVDFHGPAEIVGELNTQLKLQEGILRFMIVKKPEDGTELKVLGDVRNRGKRTQVAATHKPSAPETAKPKGEEKQIEKELADVLEKIS